MHPALFHDERICDWIGLDWIGLDWIGYHILRLTFEEAV